MVSVIGVGDVFCQDTRTRKIEMAYESLSCVRNSCVRLCVGVCVKIVEFYKISGSVGITKLERPMRES